MKIDLSKPYKSVEGSMVSFVEMRQVVLVGDWRYANKKSKDLEERTFHMVCRLSGLDESELEQLTLADYQKLADKMELGDDPKAQ